MTIFPLFHISRIISVADIPDRMTPGHSWLGMTPDDRGHFVNEEMNETSLRPVTKRIIFWGSADHSDQLTLVAPLASGWIIVTSLES